MKLNLIQQTHSLIFSVSLLFSVSVLAHGPVGHNNQSEMTSAEIKKIDAKNGTITLKHEEIKSLNMPSMTMVFSVKDKTQLENLNKGDTIWFLVDQRLNIIQIEKKQ